ncbi:MAG: hypothetical protein NTW64_01810 [Candidatus Omnitrophica bacterium]|nr:hypothetical protein [Candidatus Omnitrophota bacterium]
MLWFKIAYCVIALCISLFYGSFAVRIWIVNPKALKFTQRIYQFIFNFLSGLFGFSILYYLIYKIIVILRTDDFKSMNLGDLVLLIIAIIGTTGQLPSAIVTFTKNVGFGK